MSYKIQARNTPADNWDEDCGDYREYATIEEAESDIEAMKRLGDEWATAEYRVVEADAPETREQQEAQP